MISWLVSMQMYELKSIACLKLIACIFRCVDAAKLLANFENFVDMQLETRNRLVDNDLNSA